MGMHISMGFYLEQLLNRAFEPNLESRLSTKWRAQVLETENQGELWGTSCRGHGVRQDGEERLLPQPAQTGQWLGKAKHHQLISF